MPVRLNIGGKEYVAENAAEESTLQDILDAMQRQTSATQQQSKTISKNQQNQSINAQQSNQALGNFNQAARRTENTLEDLEHSADKAGVSLVDTAKNVASGFNSAIKGMISGLERGEVDPRAMIEGVSGAVAVGLQGLGTAAGAAIGSVIPGIGTAAGAAVGNFVGEGAGTVLTSLSSAVGAAIGIMDGFSQVTQNLANEGVIFGDGLSKATQDILDQGLTMSMFTKLVQESGAELRILGGSATQGSKRLLKLYQSLDNNKNQFINLGFALDEIPGLMAEYTASMERFGYNVNQMSDDQLAKNTLEYAKNLRLLSDLTGDDVKTAKEKKKALMEESQLQSLIARMSQTDPNASDKINTAIRMIENLGFSTDDAIKFINRGVMTGDAALLGSADGVSQTLSGIREQLLNADPSVGITDFTKGIVNTIQENVPRIQESVIRLGDISATGGDQAVALTAGLGRLAEFSRGIENLNVEEFVANADRTAETQDALAEGIASLEQSKVDMARAVQDLATELTKTSAPAITGAVEMLADAITGSVSHITGTLENITNPVGASRERLSGYQERINQLQPGEQINNSWNPYADIGLQTELDQLVASLRANNKTDAEIAEELARIGVKIDETNWAGINTYSRIAPAAPTPPTEPQTQIPAQPTVEPAPSTPESSNAYGDIIKPKPGGRIIRVAEAGEAEAVLPTERTRGGDLGIKVTGELIDSSYLMKTLVDTNKGGNNLLAALVSKIDGLNANFEKLVNEQRQANRLAV